MVVQKALKSPQPPSAAPRLATTPAELGTLAKQAKTAQGEWSKLRDEATALRQQLKTATGPKKAALEKQLSQAETKRDAALDRSSALDRELSQSIKALRGRSGGAKVKAAHDNELLGKVNGELGIARTEVAAAKSEKVAAELHKPVSKTKLAEATVKLAKAEAKVALLEAAAEAITADLKQNQTNALDEAQQFKPTDQRQEDLVDVASLTREEQIKLVGAPVADVSSDVAAKNDRRLVSITVKVAPENGAKMLARQLENASPEQQLKLVSAAANHIKTIAGQAGSAAVGDAYLAAVSNAKGPARQQLVDALLQQLPPSSLKLLTGRLEQKLAQGEQFEVAGALLTGLNAAGRTAEAKQLGGAVATSLHKLRGEFESSKKKVDDLNAKFSRATFGFGEAIPPETLQGYRDQYLQKHGEDYGKFDASSEKYLKALEAAGGFPKAALVKETPEQLAMQKLSGKSPPVTLDSELTKLAGHSAAIFESKAGQKALTAAFELQLQGKPSMLDTLMGGVNDAKSALSLTKGSADVLARTMVAVTAGKGMDAVGKLIEKNADLLGIPEGKVWEFKTLAAKSNLGELSDAAHKQALHDIEGGGYGTSIKALGLLLTAPGLIRSWSNVGSASTFEQTKLAADTLGFGSDLVKLFSKGEVLQSIATKAGKVAGVVAIPLEVLTGLGELMDGKIVDGSMSLASALGAGLMMAPGGQLVGAAIILGSAIAKKIWGDDPAERAELAAEGEVKDLLKFAGVKPETAAILSDVLQDGLRSMGPFISQMAKQLKMKPGDFLKHLDGLPKAKLQELVKMAKNMPDDGNWTLSDAKTDQFDRADVTGRAGGIYIGPKSLQTAVTWMRAREMLPAGK